MHPQPIKHSVTVDEEVLDSDNSLVYEQTENWIHAQKAILSSLIK